MTDKSKLEKLMLEAMKNIIDQDNLGIVETDTKEHSHHTQFQWENIGAYFATKVAKSNFFDAINAAFYKVHSYKWIDDETFDVAMVSELEAQGIPNEDIELSIQALEKTRKEYIDDNKNEKDVGWSENLGEMTGEVKDSQPNKEGVETFSKDNEPFTGIALDNTRPQKSKA